MARVGFKAHFKEKLKQTSFRPETDGYHLSEVFCLESLDRKRMIRKQRF